MKQRKMSGALHFRHHHHPNTSPSAHTVGHINPFGNPPSVGAGSV
jgi:hypothetical protein